MTTRAAKVVTVAAGPGGELLSYAQVIIDGQQTCAGARCTFEVPAGVHEVTARADGHLPQIQLVAIPSGEAAAINFRLERGGSSLDVSGHPEGASLVVDGRWIGRLPLHVDLAPGHHRVRVEADRFLPDERVVELKLAESKRIVDVALLPRKGRITIDVGTLGADVSLVSDSERIEHVTPGRPIDLDLSHPWTLVATRDGFQPLRAPISWNDGLDKTFVVAMEKDATSSAHR